MTEKSITKKETSELATPTASGFGSMLNAEQEDFSLDRLSLIQGTAMETEMHGDHKRGTWVYSSTGAAVAIEDVKMVSIFGYNEWIKYSEGGAGSGIEYRTMNKADVPDADLVWGTGRKGVGYAAIKHVNWVVLFEGQTVPVILSFKKTSIKSGQALMRMEAARQAAVKDGETTSPGAYIMEIRDKKFAEGSALIPVPRPAGDATSDHMEAAISWYNRLGDPNAVVGRVAAAATDDDLPF